MLFFIKSDDINNIIDSIRYMIEKSEDSYNFVCITQNLLTPEQEKIINTLLEKTGSYLYACIDLLIRDSDENDSEKNIIYINKYAIVDDTVILNPYSYKTLHKERINLSFLENIRNIIIGFIPVSILDSDNHIMERTNMEYDIRVLTQYCKKMNIYYLFENSNRAKIENQGISYIHIRENFLL